MAESKLTLIDQISVGNTDGYLSQRHHSPFGMETSSTSSTCSHGGVPETTRLLELQWDHIFYTGNGRVGRIVASAAAKHLTPVTLELSGKSPCIIDSAYDIGLAAKRILWGKINNAGQICVCPDYALVPRDKQDELIAAFQKHATDFFPEGSLKSSSSGRIVNSLHHSRLGDLLDRTKGIIVLGGHVDDENGFEVTIIKDVQDGDCLMEGEIFGPILPIIPVDNISEAIEFVNSRPHTLVIYAFSDDPVIKQQILHNTTSSNIVFKHFNNSPSMPFRSGA